MADRADPRLDGDHKLGHLLQCQLRGYTSTHPPTNQVAMRASIMCTFNKIALSSFDKAFCELFSSAFFFAMRSCKYVKVSGPQKTKLLTIRNINFLKGRRRLDHKDPLLHYADCISIAFELQKHDAKHDVITQQRSSDSLLCPVEIWAKIIWRLINYPTTHPGTSVNTFHHSNSTLHYFTGQELLQRLRKAAATVDPEVLGFSPADLGLHSAAMAMYLLGVPVFTIMLLGHWSSDTFLCYIRKQVQEFSYEISEKMIQHKSFSTISSASSLKTSCI
jgi:hypothetical protein